MRSARVSLWSAGQVEPLAEARRVLLSDSDNIQKSRKDADVRKFLQLSNKKIEGTSSNVSSKGCGNFNVSSKGCGNFSRVPAPL